MFEVDVECTEGLDGCMAGRGDVRRVVGARLTTRCEAKRGGDEFRIRVMRTPVRTGYLWGDGINWGCSGEGVDVFVG
jgi:hypothetical protein